MKTVKIPSNYRPWVCNINGVVYQYEAGTTQEVPDEVAALIESNENLAPKEAPEAGKEGQVWTKESKGADWNDVPTELPSGGNVGDFLKKTASGVEWGKTAKSTVNFIFKQGKMTCDKTFSQILEHLTAGEDVDFVCKRISPTGSVQSTKTNPIVNYTTTYLNIMFLDLAETDEIRCITVMMYTDDTISANVPTIYEP